MVTVVGKVEPHVEEAFVLADGREITFHTAYRGPGRTKPITFACNLTTWPSETARNLGILYTFMRNATHDEAVNEIALQGLEVKKVRLL